MQKESSIVDSSRFYRRGRDHRGGWITTFADVQQRFEFRSMRIGRWVNSAEKTMTAPLFYDALCDLMDILHCPERLISLRQTLSLDYGTGGQLGVMAHYEPASRTFALAKNAGPGAIAHEWFHAFDHYIAPHLIASSTHTFASEDYWQGGLIRQHPLNERLAKCFDAVFYRNAQADRTAYVNASLVLDQELGQSYYSQPCELMARAFEAFVQDAGIKNSFLVKGTQRSLDAKRGLYPKGEHRRQINQAFAHYFQALGEALARE